jgi:hypothetical protein
MAGAASNLDDWFCECLEDCFGGRCTGGHDGDVVLFIFDLEQWGYCWVYIDGDSDRVSMAPIYLSRLLFVPDDCSNGGFQTTVRMAIVNNYELKDSLALCSVLHFV